MFFMVFVLASLLILVQFSESTTNDEGRVAVGDRYLSLDNWALFEETLKCWTSMYGKWVQKKPEERDVLIKKVYQNDEALFTKVYSACGPLEKRVGLDYEWTPPSSCTSMHKFDTKKLCEIMRGRKIVFIGDSLSMHTYETMVNAIGNRTCFGLGENIKAKPGYSHNEITLSGEAYEYCSSQYSLPSFEVVLLKCRGSMYFHLIHDELLKLHQTHNLILVLNWGTNYVDDEELKVVMSNTLTWVNENMNDTLLFFRASNMAHYECDKYPVPDNFVHDPSDNPEHPEWYWSKFPRQNLLWEHFLARHPGKIFLDVFPLSSMNPSQHPGKGDCLHYCLPGPIDEWVKLIFSSLVEIEKLAENASLDPRLAHTPTDTRTSVCREPYKDNDLLRCIDSKEVFLYFKGSLHLIPSADIFMQLGRDWDEVKVISREACGDVLRGDDVQGNYRKRRRRHL